MKRKKVRVITAGIIGIMLLAAVAGTYAFLNATTNVKENLFSPKKIVNITVLEQTRPAAGTGRRLVKKRRKIMQRSRVAPPSLKRYGLRTMITRRERSQTLISASGWCPELSLTAITREPASAWRGR